MANTALMIGIQDYIAPYTLKGPRNDVADWEALAGTTFGFTVLPPLLDATATRDAVVTAFTDLLQSSTIGDHLLLFVSCHGTRTVVNGKPADGIITYTQQKPTLADVIFEDELKSWVRTGLKPGVQLTIVSDCCFSGGFGTPGPLALESRRMQEDVVRFMEIEAAADSPILGTLAKTFRRHARATETRTATTAPEPLYLAATELERGRAYEGEFNGVFRGYFSYALADAVRTKMGGGTHPTHRVAMAAADFFISRFHPDQQPTHEGPRIGNPFLT